MKDEEQNTTPAKGTKAFIPRSLKQATTSWGIRLLLLVWTEEISVHWCIYLLSQWYFLNLVFFTSASFCLPFNPGLKVPTGAVSHFNHWRADDNFLVVASSLSFERGPKEGTRSQGQGWALSAQAQPWPSACHSHSPAPSTFGTQGLHLTDVFLKFQRYAIKPLSGNGRAISLTALWTRLAQILLWTKQHSKIALECKKSVGFVNDFFLGFTLTNKMGFRLYHNSWQMYLSLSKRKLLFWWKRHGNETMVTGVVLYVQ